MKNKTNINEDHNAHHVYIHFSRIIEVSRYIFSSEVIIWLFDGNKLRALKINTDQLSFTI